MSRALLPPLPRAFRGQTIQPPADLAPWSGASGPFWHVPRAVLRPRDAEDVAHALGWAKREGVALVPRGGGTGMPGGNVAPEVVLDLSLLDALEPPRASGDAGPTLRAGAGVTGERLRHAAEEAGLDLPALPSSARWCTVGGIAACNAAGARSFLHGAARTWITEIEWVRADGTRERLARGAKPGSDWMSLLETLGASLPDPLPWPRVRKNSSGYALDAYDASGDPLDLAVGSEGTLGVITAAAVTPVPVPEARVVALVGVGSLRFLSSAAQAAADIPGVTACEYFGRRLVELGRLRQEALLEPLRLDAGFLLFELTGSRETVARGLGELEGLAWGAGITVARDPDTMKRLWGLRHAASPTIQRALSQGRRSTQFIEDSVVPVPRLGEYVQGLGEILARHETDAVVFGHAGDGNLHVNPLVDLSRGDWRDTVTHILEETVDLVASLGGTLAGEHGDGRLRTPFLDRIFHPSVVAAFRTVKERLDPAGTLNPAVIVPRTGADALAGLGAAPGFARGSQGPEGRR